MRIISSLTQFKPLSKRPAVALGVFDGLHCGHQRIIRRLIKEAKRLRTKSLLVTFFPHPQKEILLYSLSYRLKLIEGLGIDLCLVIRFTPALRKMSAEQFLQKVLIKKINPAVVVIGKNFTFGKDAKGNWQLIKEYSRKKKFKLVVMDIMTYKGKPISSSWIRNLIRRGENSSASRFLGRPVGIFGRVIRGSSLGKRLGYPTANVDAECKVLPPFGVYSARVEVGRKHFSGICYIGDKPTLKALGKRKSKTKVSVEVHIFGFKGNLYGRRIQIELIKKIRPQKKFTSLQQLACQIKKDIRLTSACLSKKN